MKTLQGFCDGAGVWAQSPSTGEEQKAPEKGDLTISRLPPTAVRTFFTHIGLIHVLSQPLLFPLNPGDSSSGPCLAVLVGKLHPQPGGVLLLYRYSRSLAGPEALGVQGGCLAVSEEESW